MRSMGSRGWVWVLVVGLVACLPVVSQATEETTLRCAGTPFVENVYWTSEYGPAPADVHQGRDNMLSCTQGDYALCYYAGAKPMTCEVDEVSGTARCQCERFTASKEFPQFVTIHSILNTCIYIETVAACGQDGSGCAEPDTAPVCAYLARGTFNRTADLISTFSLKKVGDFELGCTECTGVYAGCMTAPCHEEKDPYGNSTVICDCPLARGPYQYGREGGTCDAGEGLTWSAAYTPAGCPQKPEGTGGE